MSLRREMKRVQDLAKVVGSVREARALLADLGVRETRGFFSRRAFLDALAGRRAPVPPPASRKSAAVDCVREALAPLGVSVIRASLGKSVVVWLSAMDEPRTVRADDFGFEPIVIGSTPVAARVNVVASRQSGAPHFSASLGGGDEPIFFFVLLSERRTWLARRDELEAIEAWLDDPKRHDSPARLDARFAAHGARPRTLRLWMPLAAGTGLGVSSRIATVDGRLLGAPGAGP
ncbi:MAG: hypothetical protein IT378_10005 [Sandaracinaceae bacterium]|nr:hypothetical protein [Sandaracinaceae bacterium]